MKREEALRIVIREMAEAMGLMIEDIKETDSVSDIGIDSLDLLEVICTVEDECGCVISSTEDVSTNVSVGEFVDALLARAKKRPSARMDKPKKPR